MRTFTDSSASSGMTLPGPGVQRADGDHGGLPAGHLAGHDRLQPQHGRGGHDHRVDGGLRPRAVRAAPVQLHPQRVRRRERRARPQPEQPRRQRRHVLAQDDAGRGRTGRAGRRRSARAPPPTSSAGWNTASTVPRQEPRSRGQLRRAPSRQVTCTSWPQACMTGTVSGSWRVDGAGVRQAGLPRAPAARPCRRAAAPSARRRWPSTPTTPVRPTPVRPRSRARATGDVGRRAVLGEDSSGWACRSL